MSKLEADDLRWALQRRIEDVFAKLGEKFGDLTGRVETDIRPSVSFDDIGGLVHAKATVRGFAHALTSPDLYQQWGITPPKGVLLYGPPGTGKSKLARALATSAAAIFYHVKLFNLTSKFAANTGELLQEILRIAMSEGKAVLFLDEAEALSLEHLKARMERTAARPLFEPVDHRKILPMMGGMSGADITEILRRALEEKVHRVAEGGQASLVSTQDLLEAIDRYKRVRSVVEKIRYGQYL